MAFLGEKPTSQEHAWRELSRDEIIAAAKNFDHLPVKVRRSSGNIEDNWLISGVDEATGKIRVINIDGSGLKFYPPEELAY